MDTLVTWCRQWIKEDTFKWTNDMDLVDASPGHIECLFHTHGEHANFRGDLHGGVSVTFADTLMGAVAAISLIVGGIGVMNARIYDSVGDVITMVRGTFYALKPFDLPDLPWMVLDQKDR